MPFAIAAVSDLVPTAVERDVHHRVLAKTRHISHNCDPLRSCQAKLRDQGDPGSNTTHSGWLLDAYSLRKKLHHKLRSTAVQPLSIRMHK
jgi:hypothetical protein